MRNFIVNNNNSPQPYSTKNQGANWARNHTTSRMTRGELMNIAFVMYHHAGPYSNWFRGGMEVIANRINRIGKLRSKLSRWASTAPANWRRASSLGTLARRETGRSAKRARTSYK
jgi:hypothetical protein